MIEIFLRKFLFPIKRNISSLYNKILSVFYCGFYHFTNYGPHIVCKLAIIFWSKLDITTADQAHFQMVYRKIWILISYQQLLSQCCFSRMRCSCDQNNHLYFPFANFQMLHFTAPHNTSACRARTVPYDLCFPHHTVLVCPLQGRRWDFPRFVKPAELGPSLLILKRDSKASLLPRPD